MISLRIGLGYDLHKLVTERALILGGVIIPHNMGLYGHSDADALTHAIIDALLGAAALGNIGQHFPDTDPQFSGVNSLQLLAKVAQELSENGYEIVNIDANIIAQKPKLNPYLNTMRDTIAECLGIEKGKISIKAKTNETLGPEGREEAISTQAIALINRNHCSLPLGD